MRLMRNRPDPHELHHLGLVGYKKVRRAGHQHDRAAVDRVAAKLLY